MPELICAHGSFEGIFTAKRIGQLVDADESVFELGRRTAAEKLGVIPVFVNVNPMAIHAFKIVVFDG